MSEERTDCSPNGQATGERNERRLRAACEWSKGGVPKSSEERAARHDIRVELNAVVFVNFHPYKNPE